MLIGRKRGKTAKIDSWIGKNTVVNGDVRFSGGLHVDGRINGNAIADDADSMLEISEHGSIEGQVRVPTLILNGEVTGDVYALERVELAPRARVCGNVYYKMIEMAMGAEVNGQLVHQSEPAASVVELDITQGGKKQQGE